jgi:large subunit ribosomal protein L16
MLSPKKVKHRKVQKGRLRGKATRGQHISFGDFGIQSLQTAWVTARQIEAARVAIARFIKKGAKVWVRLFPDKPITRKPAETRMGGGKGAPEMWVCPVKPGRVLFELAGTDEANAREALRLGAQKLPVRTSFIVAED